MISSMCPVPCYHLLAGLRCERSQKQQNANEGISNSIPFLNETNLSDEFRRQLSKHNPDEV